jgi:hypothetical protein
MDRQRKDKARAVGAGGHVRSHNLLNPEKDDGLSWSLRNGVPTLRAASYSLPDRRRNAGALFLSRRGYGWAVRKGEFLNVGSGACEFRVSHYPHTSAPSGIS